MQLLQYVHECVCACVCDQQTCIFTELILIFFFTTGPISLIFLSVHIHDCMLNDLCDSQFLEKTLETLFKKKKKRKNDFHDHLDSKIDWLSFGGQRSRSWWPHVRPVLMKAISQERLKGISSNLVQVSTWARGWFWWPKVKGHRSQWHH